jgi:hypothetical protein
MPREIEQATVAIIQEICGSPLGTPDWLLRPGRTECGNRWELVCDIYHLLTGLVRRS